MQYSNSINGSQQGHPDTVVRAWRGEAACGGAIPLRGCFVHSPAWQRALQNYVCFNIAEVLDSGRDCSAGGTSSGRALKHGRGSTGGGAVYSLCPFRHRRRIDRPD